MARYVCIGSIANVSMALIVFSLSGADPIIICEYYALCRHKNESFDQIRLYFLHISGYHDTKQMLIVLRRYAIDFCHLIPYLLKGFDFLYFS